MQRILGVDHGLVSTTTPYLEPKELDVPFDLTLGSSRARLSCALRIALQGNVCWLLGVTESSQNCFERSGASHFSGSNSRACCVVYYDQLHAFEPYLFTTIHNPPLNLAAQYATMPSWHALPLELKAMIFDHLLENAVQFDQEQYRVCIAHFPTRYKAFLDEKRGTSGGSFLGYLERRDRWWAGSVAGTLRDCIADYIFDGWDDLENLVLAVPDITHLVHERLEREAEDLRLTCDRDCLRISEAQHEKDWTVRAAVAVESIKTEVMKSLCQQTRLAFRHGDLTCHCSGYEGADTIMEQTLLEPLSKMVSI